MRFFGLVCAVLTLGPVLSTSVLAQEADSGLLEPASQAASPAIAPAPGRVLAFTAGLGAQAKPGYFGAADADLGVTGALGGFYLSFGGRDFGTQDPWAVRTGLDFGASVRFVGERSADLYPELAGLTTIDPALELGGSVTYAQPAWQVFAQARFGIGGHETAVGELGMDLIVRPTDALTVTAGPRLSLGSDDFAATYFGVTPAEAAASGFNAYQAEGGVLGAGVTVEANYNLGNNWGLIGQVTWERLQGSAADSPIAQQGSIDQFSAGLVATRRFSFNF